MPTSLRRWTLLFGTLTATGCAFQAFLSYGISPIIIGGDAPGIAPALARFFATLSETLGLGPDLLATRSRALVAYGLPLLLATIFAGVLQVLLSRHRDAISDELLSSLFRWAIAFAALCLLACPIFTWDVLLSSSWGLMIVEGLNPYTEMLSPRHYGQVGMVPNPTKMTYGPLFALLSAGVVTTAGGSVVAMVAIMKTIHFLAWCGCLLLVRKIARPQGRLAEATAIMVFGWMPIGYWQAGSEVHNDILMVAPMCLWLYLRLRDNRSYAWGHISLACSILVKYVSAPLVAIDIASSFRSGALRRGRYWASVGVSALLCLAVFWRFLDWDLFGDTLRLSGRHFLAPVDVMRTALAAFGLQSALAEAATRYLIAGALLLFLGRAALAYWKSDERENLLDLVVATWAFLLFSVVGHVWPWFVLWILPVIAVRPQGFLSQFSLGVAALLPFVMIAWHASDENRAVISAASACAYLLAAALPWLIRKSALLRASTLGDA